MLKSQRFYQQESANDLAVVRRLWSEFAPVLSGAAPCEDDLWGVLGSLLPGAMATHADRRSFAHDAESDGPVDASHILASRDDCYLLAVEVQDYAFVDRRVAVTHHP